MPAPADCRLGAPMPAETIRARMLIDKLVEQVKAGAAFSFDYLLLCMVAAVLAAVGLATDNTVRAHPPPLSPPMLHGMTILLDRIPIMCSGIMLCSC